ncbi:larval cuticle protein A3A-like [Eupeodes corollae]|uniref:larval cuticle protein A3A-like n=1 Tax=Eupeodes corollae TaxID=290404 RepID=UPI002491EB4D|nr:larval cuticle protein A3A-like [Eupeodes corollae]
MEFKSFVVVLVFIGVTRAYVVPLTLISSSAPSLNLVQVKELPNPLPQYSYSYGVHDSISGDSKTQTETRNGDNVKGKYSLNDADGYKRTVSYTANAANGFQAVVERKPIADVAADIKTSIAAQSIAPAPLVIKNLTPLNSTVIPVVQPATPLIYYNPGLIHSSPLVYSAPLVSHSAAISAPLAYSAPLVVNSAPIAYTGSGTYLTQPIVNVTYAATPITHAAPYLISN